MQNHRGTSETMYVAFQYKLLFLFVMLRVCPKLLFEAYILLTIIFWENAQYPEGAFHGNSIPRVFAGMKNIFPKNGGLRKRLRYKFKRDHRPALHSLRDIRLSLKFQLICNWRRKKLTISHHRFDALPDATRPFPIHIFMETGGFPLSFIITPLFKFR